jgi:hypothetical protein
MSLLDRRPGAPDREGAERHKKNALETILPYTTVAVIVAALYVAYTFYSRHESTRKAQEAIAAQQEDARKHQVEQIYGAGEVRFTTFGADEAVITPGHSTQLCYGVLNATSVKIDPPLSEPGKVTAHHCVEISPRETTTYTITASNGKGDFKKESVTVQVK